MNLRLIFMLEWLRSSGILEISEVSNVVKGLQHGYELHRVCFPAEVKNEVYEIYHRRGLRSEGVEAGVRH